MYPARAVVYEMKWTDEECDAKAEFSKRLGLRPTGRCGVEQAVSILPKLTWIMASYTRAVSRAAAVAEIWHPNQLRHNYATLARKLFSTEHAGAALGHAKMSAT